MIEKLVFHTAFNTFASNKLARRVKPGERHPVETWEWTERRIEIWKRFTLQSILNQKYENFFYVLLLNPGMRRMTEALLPKLGDRRIIYCYDDGTTLGMIKGCDEIVLAFMDSDDMYSKYAGQLMMDCRAEWMYFKIGYAYDVRANKLYNYDTRGTGPFYAQRLDPEKLKAFNRTKHHPCHEDVMKFKPRKLEDGHFCVGMHDKNISNYPRISNVIRRPVNLRILTDLFGQGHPK